MKFKECIILFLGFAINLKSEKLIGTFASADIITFNKIYIALGLSLDVSHFRPSLHCILKWKAQPMIFGIVEFRKSKNFSSLYLGAGYNYDNNFSIDLLGTIHENKLLINLRILRIFDDECEIGMFYENLEKKTTNTTPITKNNNKPQTSTISLQTTEYTNPTTSEDSTSNISSDNAGNLVIETIFHEHITPENDSNFTLSLTDIENLTPPEVKNELDINISEWLKSEYHFDTLNNYNYDFFQKFSTFQDCSTPILSKNKQEKYKNSLEHFHSYVGDKEINKNLGDKNTKSLLKNFLQQAHLSPKGEEISQTNIPDFIGISRVNDEIKLKQVDIVGQYQSNLRSSKYLNEKYQQNISDKLNNCTKNKTKIELEKTNINDKISNLEQKNLMYSELLSSIDEEINSETNFTNTPSLNHTFEISNLEIINKHQKLLKEKQIAEKKIQNISENILSDIRLRYNDQLKNEINLIINNESKQLNDIALAKKNFINNLTKNINENLLLDINEYFLMINEKQLLEIELIKFQHNKKIYQLIENKLKNMAQPSENIENKLPNIIEYKNIIKNESDLIINLIQKINEKEDETYKNYQKHIHNEFYNILLNDEVVQEYYINLRNINNKLISIEEICFSDEAIKYLEDQQQSKQLKQSQLIEIKQRKEHIFIDQQTKRIFLNLSQKIQFNQIILGSQKEILKKQTSYLNFQISTMQKKIEHLTKKKKQTPSPHTINKILLISNLAYLISLLKKNMKITLKNTLYSHKNNGEQYVIHLTIGPNEIHHNNIFLDIIQQMYKTRGNNLKNEKNKIKTIFEKYNNAIK